MPSTRRTRHGKKCAALPFDVTEEVVPRLNSVGSYESYKIFDYSSDRFVKFERLVPTSYC